jgi:hypothetical protein
LIENLAAAGLPLAKFVILPVNFSFFTVIVFDFFLFQNLLQIESHRKKREKDIRSAHDSIWAKTFDSITGYDLIWQPCRVLCQHDHDAVLCELSNKFKKSSCSVQEGCSLVVRSKENLS